MKSTQSRASSPMRPSRKPRIILILLIALCGLFVYSYTSRLMEKAQVESQIADLEARIDAAEMEHAELLAELESLSRPDYIDWVARTKFGLVKPGDTALMMVKQPESQVMRQENAVHATSRSPMDARTLPVWQQWILYFTTEAFTLSIQ